MCSKDVIICFMTNTAKLVSREGLEPSTPGLKEQGPLNHNYSSQITSIANATIIRDSVALSSSYLCLINGGVFGGILYLLFNPFWSMFWNGILFSRAKNKIPPFNLAGDGGNSKNCEANVVSTPLAYYITSRFGVFGGEKCPM